MRRTTAPPQVARHPLSVIAPVVLTLLALVSLSACADNGQPEQSGSAVIVTTTVAAPATTPASTQPSAQPSTPAATTEPPTDQPDTGSTVVPASTGTEPGRTEPEPLVGDPQVEAVAIGQFDAPLDLVVRPGDDALYIVEQPGRIVRFADDAQTVVADITDRTEASSERGLLGLAFSVDGSHAYLHYSDLSGDTVVDEYPVGTDGRFDVADRRVVFTLDQPYSNHNGGDLAIGPDGMLLIALGDGGSGGDPERRASDPTSLLGSLLRIDPRPDGDQPYTIPGDNPFANGEFGGIVGAPEVWAWGLRNPWKFAFDPITNDLWIADVGQNEYEEVNRVAPVGDAVAGRAADFGWSAFEGTERFNTDVPDNDPILPVLTYRQGDDGCSISGGVPYRGAAIPDLAPAYVYSDYCSGIVWALDLAGGRNLTLLDGFEQVSAVRAGPDDEIYVLELTGTVHRLVPSR